MRTMKLAVAVLVGAVGCAGIEVLDEPAEAATIAPTPQKKLPASLDECPAFSDLKRTDWEVAGHCERLRKRAESDARQKAEDARQKAEAERIAKSEADMQAARAAYAAAQEEAARLDEVMRAPKAEATILSALACEAEIRKAAALEGIREEREASKIAGVVNNARLYALQQAAYSGGKEANAYRAELRRRKLKATRCDDTTVRTMVACHAIEWNDEFCANSEQDAARAAAFERAFQRLSLAD